MSKLFRVIDCMGFTNLKLVVMKYLFRKKIQFSLIHVISSNTRIELAKGAKLNLGKMTNITGSMLCIRENGLLDIQKGVFMNSGVIVTCRERISIGEDTLFGPNVLIYDHDHAINKDGFVEKKKFVAKPVEIGKGCWIGAGTIILKGTVIGENSIVGAGCVLNGTYPSNSVIVQKRETSIREKRISGEDKW